MHVSTAACSGREQHPGVGPAYFFLRARGVFRLFGREGVAAFLTSFRWQPCGHGTVLCEGRLGPDCRSGLLAVQCSVRL